MAVATITCIPGAGLANLKRYLGKSVEDFCPLGYGKVGDAESHCAHFVAHALNIQVGKVCTGLLEWKETKGTTRASVRSNQKAGMQGFLGASTRVNEIFNSLPAGSKGDWDSRSAGDCLIYAVPLDYVPLDRSTMSDRPKKHIGIFSQDSVWHYGNSNDKVRCDPLEQFMQKFRSQYGASTIFLWSVIPDVGAACVHAG